MFAEKLWIRCPAEANKRRQPFDTRQRENRRAIEAGRPEVDRRSPLAT